MSSERADHDYIGDTKMHTVKSLVATTSPQQPVFKNTKSFQVKSLLLGTSCKQPTSPKSPQPLLELKV